MRARLDRWLAPAVLLAAGLFSLQHAPWSGLHADDHGFHLALAEADWPALWRSFLAYVPGRNLHILIAAGSYKLLGSSPFSQHLAGLTLDLLAGALAYALALALGVRRSAALIVAALFLVYPNHAETHYWLSSMPMNLASTALVLGSFLVARRSLGAALALWALAAFIYDQVFFMWVPLAVYAGLFAPPPRYSRGAVAAFAAAALSLNVVHVALRTMVSVTMGPKIRLSSLLSNGWASVAETVVPLRKLPPWESLQSWAGGPWVTLAALGLLTAALAAAVARLERAESPRASSSPIIVGGLWWLCAYLPNYFWFISPRHNYLPSLGWLLALVPAAQILLPGKVFRWAACSLFALSAASTLAAGHGWRVSAQAHEAFRRAAPSLVPPPSAALFVLGAPRSLARAPAFDHPDEARYLYSQRTGHFPPAGDLLACASRSGIFYGNEVELFGRRSLSFTPAEGADVLLYGNGRWACAASISIQPDGLPAVTMPLRPRPGCTATAERFAPVWLLESRAVKAEGSGPAAANGVELIGAAASMVGARIALELVWRSPRRVEREFAAMAAFIDAEGKTVFEPAYSFPLPGGKEHLALWPLYDDLRPATLWKTGEERLQRYQLRPVGEPLSATSLRLSILERREGPWADLGTIEVPLRWQHPL